MVVVNCAQAHKQLEEELLRREKELLAGAKPSPVESEQGESGAEATETQQAEEAKQLTKDQRKQMRQQCREGEKGEEELNKHSLDLSAEKLQALQEKDATLAKVREAADGHPRSAGVGFLGLC